MRLLLSLSLTLIAAAVFAQDRVTLSDGRIQECKVLRFSGGVFACQTPNGIVLEQPQENIKSIAFDAGPMSPRQGVASTAPLVGRFYVDVDDAATLYVNGTKLYRAGVGASYSGETSINVGDAIVASLENFKGPSRFRLAFVTTDRRSVVVFKASDFKQLGMQPILEITAATISKTLEAPQRLKLPPNEQLLPITPKEHPDAVWGNGRNCLVGACLTREMISTPRR